MTPEECAENILTLLDLCKKYQDEGVFEAMVLEIRAVVREAMDSDEVVGNQLRLARHEAYEDAAKIAIECDWTNYDEASSGGFGDAVAKAILARAAEVGK